MVRVSLITAIAFFGGLLISNAAQADNFTLPQAEAVLNQKAKDLGYKIHFRAHNCTKTEPATCELNAFTAAAKFTILAQATSAPANSVAFTIMVPTAPANLVLAMLSESIITTALSSEKYDVDETTSFLLQQVDVVRDQMAADDSKSEVTAEIGDTTQTVGLGLFTTIYIEAKH